MTVENCSLDQDQDIQWTGHRGLRPGPASIGWLEQHYQASRPTTVGYHRVLAYYYYYSIMTS